MKKITNVKLIFVLIVLSFSILNVVNINETTSKLNSNKHLGSSSSSNDIVNSEKISQFPLNLNIINESFKIKEATL